ncbi:hypothetical protein SODALDRAFT_20693 [Sodiomyces alkalinus F11]|uniref:Uncharacterized protein n=1 Tax=Sodiomyces alkalinus (strain CBS 110278 / VKM F-3762 / F11) TaxID=1314773 RepID=A0A3N2Q7K9_SODAK|nr:hypothetical protein SODALDRAFT_20693 [Sodiomyces alkalinus F11]ROT42667.1 hypothetical protein SODALDRAFT_20693 [Sodiomyces alkalinus F11]
MATERLDAPQNRAESRIRTRRQLTNLREHYAHTLEQYSAVAQRSMLLLERAIAELAQQAANAAASGATAGGNAHMTSQAFWVEVRVRCSAWERPCKNSATSQRRLRCMSSVELSRDAWDLGDDGSDSSYFWSYRVNPGQVATARWWERPVGSDIRDVPRASSMIGLFSGSE